MPVELCGVAVQLYAGGAVLVAGESSLLVADLHLGKDSTFRRSGLAVPSGTNESTLQQVSRLLELTSAKRLVMLGDLIHARSSLSRGVVETFAEFRESHSDVEFSLVRGNHDRVSRFPDAWGLSELPAGSILGELRLHHEPTDRGGQNGERVLDVAGHLHPSFRLQSRTESLGRLPCFWFRRGCLVLPAIGEFTGTHNIRRGRLDRIWVDANGTLMEIPSKADLG